MQTLIAPIRAVMKPVGQYRKILNPKVLGVEGFVVRNGILLPVRNFQADLAQTLAHSVMQEARIRHGEEAPGIGFNHFLNALVGLTNAGETGILNLIFTNANYANIGDATGLRGSTVAGSFYISLHSADPAETGSQTSNEIAYTTYARVAVARSGAGWTVSGTAPTQAVNAAAITFPDCTAGSATATYAGIGTDLSAAGNLIFGGTTNSLSISAGITPAFTTTGDLVITLE